jgi:glycerol uptake facilitator-like aquaporin
MTTPAGADVCFFERDPAHALARRAGAEAIGTLMLMFAASGSAIVAASFGVPNAAALLMHALATSGALVGLIIAFGAVSGGHFNPIITMGQWLRRERSTSCTLTYVVCQIVGGIAGGILARFVFAIPIAPVGPATSSLFTGEVIATAGLMIIVFGASRAKRSESGPFAVGAYLSGMIVFSPSSYANPAIAIGALAATGPIVVRSDTAALFVMAQIIGGLAALGIVEFSFGRSGASDPKSGSLP